MSSTEDPTSADPSGGHPENPDEYPADDVWNEEDLDPSTVQYDDGTDLGVDLGVAEGV
ncbi:hypothetical protein HK102_010393, partial [Quaeritorhiza haematococci]